MNDEMSLWHRAQDCIAQDTLTNSKHPTSFVNGVYPKYVDFGQESCLFCQSGKTYVDYICGLGTNIVGYGNHVIATALKEALYHGFSHSLPTRHEVAAAEKVKEVMPFIEMVKFVKTGTEACLAAIRIARCATGRTKVLTHGYHGWSDPFICNQPPAHGVWLPNGVLPLTDIELLDDSYAAVIIEPIITDNGPERIKWLQDLRERCSKYGIVLIFDEIITGFRYKQFSASRFHNVHPDLLCIGKALANGLPLAAICGPKSLMSDRRYFVSSTYAGEILSLIAAKVTIGLLQTNRTFSMDNVWPHGQAFIDKFNSLFPEKIQIKGYPTRGVFEGCDFTIALFFQEAVKAGLLFGKSFFYNSGHIEYDALSLSSIENILSGIKAGIYRLEGEMPQSPFAQKVREKK